MKAPSKTKRMKKYMILFSILLFIVVLSTALAFYMGTKNVVGDIPKKVGEEFKVLPVVQKMEGSLNNLTGGQGNLDKGSEIHCRKIGAQITQIILYLHMYYICKLWIQLMYHISIAIFHLFSPFF